MSGAKFTPGPWRWTEFSDEGVWDMKRARPEEGGPFQGLWSESEERAVAIAQDASAYTANFIDGDSADAHLIASAPDLFAVVQDGALEATEKALRAIRAFDDEADPYPHALIGEALEELEAWGQRADAVLRKARGEEVVL